MHGKKVFIDFCKLPCEERIDLDCHKLDYLLELIYNISGTSFMNKLDYTIIIDSFLNELESLHNNVAITTSSITNQ